ncbi:bifunctional translation initiation inhibitor [Leptospira ryugenii]|uniref:Bifunctional translation initiation inhibitor n=1 Tax=Leptospira ryugenii TaxID=1917863 RepID=A0A2P2DXA5_9LEPT|nr:RidA family protein [Leptospira ryugenii]GBF49236.1 bifunctional translation initiation inhibitor [Leptospira ryugenii]
MHPLERLESLGLKLPAVPQALALYLPSQKVGNLVFTSGQLPLVNGALEAKGKVGESASLELAKKQAEICCLNALSTLLMHIKDLSEVKKIVKLGVYVASHPNFTEQHLVANGASELLVSLFGEQGKHARFAIGVSSLPLDAIVELELVAEV